MDRLDAADVNLPHLRVRALILAVIGVVLMVACGGAAPSPSTPLPASGRFTFSAQGGSGSHAYSFGGVFEVVADTVLLRLNGADCQPLPRSVDELGYQCLAGGGLDPVQIRFKRANPVRQPKAVVTTRTPETTNTCVQYGHSDDGRRICLRSTTVTKYVVRTQTLYLQPRAVP